MDVEAVIPHVRARVKEEFCANCKPRLLESAQCPVPGEQSFVAACRGDYTASAGCRLGCRSARRWAIEPDRTAW